MSSDAKKSPAGPDMELKRAFAELQAKTAETKRRLKIIDMQVTAKKNLGILQRCLSAYPTINGVVCKIDALLEYVYRTTYTWHAHFLHVWHTILCDL